MISSSKKIIKLKKPIKSVVVVPLENNDKSGDNQGYFRDDIVQVSQGELNQELEFNYAKGLEEGKISGYQQAEKDFEKKFKELTQVFQSLHEDRLEFYKQNESVLFEFSLNLIRKIVREIPAFLPGLIKNSIHSVLKVLSNEPVIEIVLNPDDMNEFKELDETFETAIPGIEKFSVKTDPRITRGGCLVKTNSGKIDARIESQISKLTQEVKKELSNLNR